MSTHITPANIDADVLRSMVRDKYAEVATNPEHGFHFHVGGPLARKLGYAEAALGWLPQGTVDSFAGTGNPFEFGVLATGERVVDVGCGAGFDSLQAARHVGPSGRVIGVDMTPQMLEKAAAGAAQIGLENVELRHGQAEHLPVEDGWADVVISNGVINLCHDKLAVMREIYRVLRPGGRIQIADILVHNEVPQDAKDDIALWSG